MSPRLLWIPAMLALLGPCSRNEAPAPPPPPPIPVPATLPPSSVPVPVPVPPATSQTVPPGTPMPVPGQPIAPPGGGQPVAAPGGAQPAAAAAPGTLRVTVTATSTPPGASVSTQQGRVLGTTPLVTTEVIPAPAPGQPPPTFSFVFTLPGHPPQTVSASPMNDILALAATFPPQGSTVPPIPGMPGAPTPGIPMPGTPMPGTPPVVPGMPPIAGALTIQGTGGGAIFDNHTTTATAFVPQPCTVASLRVALRGSHTFYSDLTVRLHPPSGNALSLQRRSRRNPFRSYSVPRAAGMQAQGTWRLTIADTVLQDAGRLTAFVLEVVCR